MGRRTDKTNAGIGKKIYNYILKQSDFCRVALFLYTFLGVPLCLGGEKTKTGLLKIIRVRI